MECPEVVILQGQNVLMSIENKYINIKYYKVNIMNKNKERLNKVVESLGRVPNDTKQMIYQLSMELSEMEIIQFFNQQGRDLFRILHEITHKHKDSKKFNISGYKMFFDQALKINAKLPIDKFTLIVLEYAPEIYAEEEDCFMAMTIPDTKVNVGNEFGLIRTQMFKDLWVTLDKSKKDELSEVVILLTTYAHAYLYKTLMIINK